MVTAKIIFTIPRLIPKATPRATAIINVRFLKAPLVKFSTVWPSAFSAGSARVAPNPNAQAKARAMAIPTATEYSGEAGISWTEANAPATKPPD